MKNIKYKVFIQRKKSTKRKSNNRMKRMVKDLNKIVNHRKRSKQNRRFDYSRSGSKN